MTKLILGVQTFCFFLAISFSSCYGQALSNTPIRLIIGVAPGGSLDSSARSIAQALQRSMHRPVLVENKPGANMLIATKYVMGSKPDGDILLIGTGTITLNPLVYPKENVNPLKDLAPIAMLAVTPMVVAVSPALKINAIQDLISYAKANPGKLNFSAGTVGFRVAGEAFMRSAGVEMTAIPYSGAGPAMNALLAGDVQVTVLDEGTLTGFLKSDRLKGLLISGSQRSKNFPDIPTGKDAGLGGFDVVSWSGLFAPPQTPPATITLLHERVQAALGSSEVANSFPSIGFQAVKASSAEFQDRIQRDMDMYRAVSQRIQLLPQ